MNVVFGALCAGAAIFMLRVLVALVREARRHATRPRQVYLAKFAPVRTPGELIVMKKEVSRPKSAVDATRRAALGLLVVVSMTAVTHGQQISGPAVSNNGTTDTGASVDKQTNKDVLQELEVMKQRIAELEAKLKERDSAVDASAPGATQPPASVPMISSAVTSAVTANSSPAQSAAEEKKAPAEPFAFADWSWLNGNPRTKEPAFDSKFFTPEIRADVEYTYDFNHPQDDTIGGSTEVFRSNEIGVTQLGVGGDFHFDHARARLMTQFGMYSQTTPRNDASYSRGQWNLADAYRYLSEAYGGYHWDALHGVNVDAGIFMSYVGLFSYYNFDNWAYQPSYVSSNTPWFFTGMRIQVFPTEKLKIEPWIINGWQSYARFNGRLGLGGQILYRPTSWMSLISNNYGVGADALGIPNRTRYHSDNSLEVKYYDRPERFLDKMAFTLTGDIGCESGGGVNCTTNKKDPSGKIVDYKQSFLGYMVYNRWWFKKDRYAVTVGGGEINNPGRYLVLLPPINGTTATSGTPYFTENPGDPFKAWDISGTYDYMPSQYITFRWEFNHRHASVPYWSGPGGVTPPGGNTGAPGSIVSGWSPDLRKTEDRATMAILVKF